MISTNFKVTECYPNNKPNKQYKSAVVDLIAKSILKCKLKLKTERVTEVLLIGMLVECFFKKFQTKSVLPKNRFI